MKLYHGFLDSDDVLILVKNDITCRITRRQENEDFFALFLEAVPSFVGGSWQFRFQADIKDGIVRASSFEDEDDLAIAYVRNPPLPEQLDAYIELSTDSSHRDADELRKEFRAQNAEALVIAIELISHLDLSQHTVRIFEGRFKKLGVIIIDEKLIIKVSD